MTDHLRTIFLAVVAFVLAAWAGSLGAGIVGGMGAHVDLIVEHPSCGRAAELRKQRQQLSDRGRLLTLDLQALGVAPEGHPSAVDPGALLGAVQACVPPGAARAVHCSEYPCLVLVGGDQAEAVAGCAVAGFQVGAVPAEGFTVAVLTDPARPAPERTVARAKALPAAWEAARKGLTR